MKLRECFYGFLDLFSSWYTSLNSSNFRVLAYHDIPDEIKFEKQINYLREKFNIIDIPTFEKYLSNGQQIPPNSLLITFDDGDISVLRKGLPILKKYKVPACIFVVTQLINSKNDFWWNSVRTHERIAGKKPADISKTIQVLKTISNKERLHKLDKYPVTDKDQFTIENLKELQNNHVYIANHSHTHPMFDNCTIDEIKQEIEDSKSMFEHFGVGDYSILAYPNGNYNEKSERILRDYNFKMAFLFDHKLNKNPIHPFRISRIRVDSYLPLREFRVKVSGLHSFIYSGK